MSTLGKPLLSHFPFPATSININNGSFGSYPTQIRDALNSYQQQTDAEPDIFIRYKLPALIDRSRAAVASLINARSVDDVVLVPNVTTGVNTILWNLSLNFSAGDKIVYLGTTYGSCEKIIDFIGEYSSSVEAVRVDIQYPISKAAILQKFQHAISQPGVRVTLFDTVSSMPAFCLPCEEMVALCRQYNVLSLVDGAHGIGCIPLDMQRLDADFFGRWLFMPRSCAALHIPARNQHLIRSSLPTSHGYIPIHKPGKPVIKNPLPVSKNPAFVQLFEFVGTLDYTPYLCVPDALRYRQEICGGEEVIMRYCIDLAQRGSELVAQMLGTEVLGEQWQRECPMAMVRLPIDNVSGLSETRQAEIGPWIEKEGAEVHGFFAPVILHNENLLVRLSAQVYLTLQDFESVGRALVISAVGLLMRDTHCALWTLDSGLWTLDPGLRKWSHVEQ
ncbi:putative aminotransferase C660,12c [Talaromyces islandicus]|uniref:Putative aminotransferase C660,12c n=1 Tax=Talaromyces islandicus TaxID=28573 RepID=A0A0U1M8I0_TALIS|nr:putative aminotransferase C660,12c [Talaromyces islandicus]